MSDKRNRGTLITGTDTDSGKTLITCAVVAGLRARGLSVGVFKPVETGCEIVRHKPQGADVAKLVAAGGGTQPVETASSYLFELPAAPLVAAEAAGTRIDPLRIVADYERLTKDYDVVMVEGAGGLFVPIADGYTYMDFSRHVGLPLLCVVGSRLGCINHALLTLYALDHSELHVHGYLVNEMAPDTPDRVSAELNRRTIARFTDNRDLGLFPYIPSDMRTDYDALGRVAEEALDLVRFV